MPLNKFCPGDIDYKLSLDFLRTQLIKKLVVTEISKENSVTDFVFCIDKCREFNRGTNKQSVIKRSLTVKGIETEREEKLKDVRIFPLNT